MSKETVFALSTGLGKAGIAIVRVSGSKAFEVVKELTGVVPPAKLATLRSLSFNQELIDKNS